MGTIANLVVRINGDMSGLKTALSDAGAAVSSAGEKMQGMGTKLSVGVTAPILGMAGAAIKAAADQEQLQIAFTTMLGSAEQATKLMGEINAFSAATPFQSTEVQESAKMLLAFGVSADETIGTLRQLGDLSAGVGAPLKDLAYLFGTSRTQGRLFAADVNQFTSRGIPIIEALAETMGVAQNEVRGLVEEGKVGFPELQAALGYLTGEGGKFTGLMEAQSQSMAGLFSTLKDNIELSAAAIGKTLIEQFDLKGKLQNVLGWTDQLKTAVLDLAENNPELFRLGAILAGLAAAAGPALIGLGTAVKFAGTALAALGPVIGFVLSPMGLLIGAAAVLGVAWANNWGGIRDVTAAAVEAIKPILDDLWSAIEWIWNGEGANIDWWYEITDAIGALVGLDSGSLNWLADAFYEAGAAASEFIQGTRDAWDRLNEAIAEGNTSITGLVTALTGSGETAAAFNQTLTDIGTTVTDLATTAAGELQAFIATATTVGQQIADVLAPGFDRVGEALGTLPATFGELLPHLQSAGEAFAGLAQAVQPLIQLVGTALVVAASFGVNAFAAIIANLPGIIGPIIDQVTATITLISTTITEVVNIVKAIIDGDWAAAWAAAQRLVGGFGTFFASTLENVKTSTTTIFGAVKDAVTNTLSDLGVSMQDIMNGIAGWWGAAWEGLKTGMQPLLDGFASISGAIEGAQTALEGFRDWLGGLQVPNPFAGVANTLGGIQSGVAGLFGGGGENNQLGTSYAHGGWSWVGENRRPELLYLPRGSQVVPWREAQAMGGGGGGVTVTIANANVRNERDLYGLAYRINDIAERRSRQRRKA